MTALCVEYFADIGGLSRAPVLDGRYALLVVARGTVEIELDGQLVHLTARDAVLFPPDRSYRAVSGSAPALWLASFNASEAAVLLPSTRESVHRLSAERHDAVLAVMRLLSETDAEETPHRRFVRRLHFAAVLASIFESTDAREFLPAGSNSLVREALELIDRRYAESIGPAEIARAIGRHPAYLTRVVREETGKSLGSWLIERRLGAARVLLINTNESIGTIAAAVGYVDASHFARYFTRLYGAPPARWRRKRSA
jgi:AraC-like DNA-binding protein